MFNSLCLVLKLLADADFKKVDREINNLVDAI